MLKMRLQRIGRKNNPSYRLIVTDSRNAASRGRSVDLLGSYEPKLGTIIIDKEKAKLKAEAEAKAKAEADAKAAKEAEEAAKAAAEAEPEVAAEEAKTEEVAA